MSRRGWLGQQAKRRVAIAGLSALVIANIALFVVLQRNLLAAPVARGDLPTPSSSSSAPPTEANGAVTLVQSQRGYLARVTRGQCTADGRPRIDLSLDGGEKFSEVALPLLGSSEGSNPGDAPQTVRTILSFQADSPTEFTVVASDDECTSRGFKTDDGGRSWQRSKIADEWFVDAPGTGVVSPDGATEPGCAVISLAPLSDRNAKVLCDNDLVLGTDDNGQRWVTLGSLDGVTAGLFGGLYDGYAIAPGGACTSRFYVTTDAGGVWTPGKCVSKAEVVTSLVGSTAQLYALVGDNVLTSVDLGKTWKRA
ncbi:hypothetical protein J2X11_000778 [Aeromicrobium panaciterrae]|uniref:Exo-alpha-sialidase n=1 Tax=Aeromicrobium panaciterrae TaxID=363861 RepID=A0ABU1ULB3_9ACTN|nr:hypothetical protein [Aeromicrobium panaciterrae]MDR7085939.1 hypothetical protein [Aeromicrobium panaciterrae]